MLANAFSAGSQGTELMTSSLELIAISEALRKREWYHARSFEEHVQADRSDEARLNRGRVEGLDPDSFIRDKSVVDCERFLNIAVGQTNQGRSFRREEC